MCVCVCVCVCCVSCSVYSGHQSILIPPVELESNPALWLLAVSQLRVRDTFCSYSVMELCTKGLGLQTEALKVSEHLIRHVTSHVAYLKHFQPQEVCQMFIYLHFHCRNKVLFFFFLATLLDRQLIFLVRLPLINCETSPDLTYSQT